MIVFPNCKINLGLNITGKRADGYHDLETVFFPVRLTDILEIILKKNFKSEMGTGSFAQFTSSGIPLPIDLKENICLKAFQIAISAAVDEIPSLEIHLHKTIPAGAGLGGGSADGAFTLMLLNDLLKLNLTTDQLLQYALALGSDCPFFIINKPCFATGRGEILQEINLDLSDYKIIIVNPGIHINTANAFSKIKPAIPAKSIKEIIQQPITTWKDELKNDFENAVFEEYPEVAVIKKTFYDNGAVYASMSGSGSTVYGIFNQSQTLSFNFPEQYFVYTEPHRNIV